MYSKDKANLLAVLDCIDKILRFTSRHENADSFFQDEITFDAVLMNFVVIGESVSRLSEDIKSHHMQIPWIKIKGFRNMIAHDYFGVDAEEVWQIIFKELHILKGQIQSLIDK